VGVTLNIVAEVTGDNFIILKVNPTVSEISEAHLDKDGIPSLAPDIKVKQLSSIVKVKNEKRVLLGGLIQKRTDDKETKVPLLGNIPLLGRMFKSNSKVESKSEMVIVLTPTLVRGDEGDHTLSQLEEELGK
jgi:general secretion pathway protein D